MFWPEGKRVERGGREPAEVRSLTRKQLHKRRHKVGKVYAEQSPPPLPGLYPGIVAAFARLSR